MRSGGSSVRVYGNFDLHYLSRRPLLFEQSESGRFHRHSRHIHTTHLIPWLSRKEGIVMSQTIAFQKSKHRLPHVCKSPLNRFPSLLFLSLFLSRFSSNWRRNRHSISPKVSRDLFNVSHLSNLFGVKVSCVDFSIDGNKLCVVCSINII